MIAPNVLAILCVRADSERLPGKALLELGDKTVLEHIVARLRLAKSIRKIVIATSDEASDDFVGYLAAKTRVDLFRGSKTDVASRMDGAVCRFMEVNDLILRVMGDQPFLDWQQLDQSASLMRVHEWDVVLPLSFREDPVYGAGLSPWSMRAWKWIASMSSGEEREHVGMRLRRDLSRFAYGLVDLPHWCYRPYRLELDTDADLACFRAIWNAWTGPGEPELSWVVDLLDRRPEIAHLNGHIREKTGTFTSFARDEIEAWQKDYRQREVVFSDVPSLVGDLRGSDTNAARCHKCAGYLVAQRVRDGDLRMRCLRCGSSQTFYAMKPG